jgi:hypothetical protein
VSQVQGSDAPFGLQPVAGDQQDESGTPLRDNYDKRLMVVTPGGGAQRGCAMSAAGKSSLMDHSVSLHLAAAKLHSRAADAYDRATDFWAAVGDAKRAVAAERAANRELAAAAFERGRALTELRRAAAERSQPTLIAPTAGDIPSTTG